MNETKKKERGLEVNVGELLLVLLRRWWLIVLCGIITASAFWISTKLFVKPVYQSVTKIFVLSQQEGNYLTTTDIQLSSYLTKDYAELIKSRTVAQEVIERLDLKMTPDGLMSLVSVYTKADTRIVTISVRNADPKLAQELANVIREVSAKQIVDVMGVEAVNMVDEANLPTEPFSPNVRNNALMGAAWGCLFAIALILLRHLLDDTIKSEEDVERYLELNVLAAIPVIEQPAAKKGGKFTCQTSK